MTIMKKEYISPLTSLFLIETQQMIAASTLVKDQDNQTVKPTDEEYEGEFGSRRHNVWDDEEEEDEQY